jgi:hypothetical protein
MFKSLCAFSLLIFATGPLLAQQVTLPPPGGPGGLTPPPSSASPNMPAQTPAETAPIATVPVETAPVETAPVLTTPTQPISYQKVVYTLGTASTLVNGSMDYTFRTDAVYNTVNVVSVVGTSGNIAVNSVRIVHSNGIVTDLGDILTDNYHADQGRVCLMLEEDVTAIIVNARNASPRGRAPGSFRVDVSVSHKR